MKAMKKNLLDFARRRPFAAAVLAAVLSSLLFNGYFIPASWYTVSSIGYGGLFVLNAYLPLGLVFLAAFLALPVSMALLLSKRHRRHALRILVAAILYVGIAWVCIRAGQTVRHWGFEKQAERGNMVVEAIEDYESKYGFPPDSLQALVPEFLPSVPSTGMPAYPQYEYVAGPEAEKWDGNPWVLYIHCSSGGINFDQFIYFPRQNYPEEGYGGSLERIGEWAYVHE